jgi:hypothetical protein
MGQARKARAEFAKSALVDRAMEDTFKVFNHEKAYEFVDKQVWAEHNREKLVKGLKVYEDLVASDFEARTVRS